MFCILIENAVGGRFIIRIKSRTDRSFICNSNVDNVQSKKKSFRIIKKLWNPNNSNNILFGHFVFCSWFHLYFVCVAYRKN